jgi:hypothetical protein
VAGVLIRIWIHSTHPLAGTAAVEGNDPLHFDGWLELLRVISGFVVADKPAREKQTGGSGGD